MNISSANHIVDRYKEYPDKDVVSAIQYLRDIVDEVRVSKTQSDKLVDKMQIIKWHPHYLHELPHDDNNPGVQATYLIWDLRGVKH